MEPTFNAAGFNGATSANATQSGQESLGQLGQREQIMVRLFSSVVNKLMDEAKTNGNVSA